MLPLSALNMNREIGVRCLGDVLANVVLWVCAKGVFCVSCVSILPGKPRKPQLLFKETPSQRYVAHM